ncbi:MAG: anti-sigma factor [Methyloligellaceae bacterium]
MSGFIGGRAVQIMLLCVVLVASGCERQVNWLFNSKERQLSAQPVGNFVTVLRAAKTNKAVFTASVDTKKGVIRVQNLKGNPKGGKSFELWAIGAGEKPLSLGVVDKSVNIPASKLGSSNPDFLKNISFAISVEPYGGSRTGQPTGPVLYTGKLEPAAKTGGQGA